MRRLAALTLLAFTLAGRVFGPPLVHAAWPHDPLVNFAVGSAVVSNTPSAILSDDFGGAFIAMRVGVTPNIDIYLQHVRGDGTVAPGWPAGGVVVCNAAGDQIDACLARDGQSGVYVAWRDQRLGPTNSDIYVQRIDSYGFVGAGWPTNGRLLSNSFETKDEYGPRIVSEAVAGAIISWTLVASPGTDEDIYAARVNDAGYVWFSSGIDVSGDIQNQGVSCPDLSGGAWIAYTSHNASSGLDIRVAHVTPAGTITLRDACTHVADQQQPQIAADGVAGCFVAWLDARNGNSDIYEQHLTADATIGPGFAPDGNPVCIQSDSQGGHVIIDDNAGGAYLAWLDMRYDVVAGDLFAIRMGPGGTPSPGWPMNGEQVVSEVGSNQYTALVKDGTGGVILVDADSRGLTADFDVYAIRLNPNGAYAPGWRFGGNPVSSAAGTQTMTVAASDRNGGAFCAWADSRLGQPQTVTYMQNIDRFGQLGDASPAFISVRDVPGDQGGKVALKWNASYLDAEPTDGIANYWIWRQAPSTSAEAAVRRGARWLDADLDRAAAQMTGDELGALAARGLYMRTSLDATQYAWEFVGSQPAAEFAQYSYVVPTIGDSTSGHNPYTPFLVQARSIVANAFWNAAPDSGYSVDNIAPATPAPFTGVYAGGSTLLDWGANHEADLAAYRLYRGSSAGFVPGPGNLVVETSSTQYTDAPGGPYVYKLAAVDLHGNVSPYALVVPSGTTDVGPTLPAVLALAPAFPNPARGSSTLDFALPREARVELALYDTGGRRVRTLVDATLPAGHHAARWDGRDDAGTLEPSGVYFVSMRSEGRELRRRLAFVR